MAIQNVSGLVYQNREGLRRPDLVYPGRTLPQSWAKKVSPRKLFEGRRNNSRTEIKKSILAKMTIIWPLTSTFGLGQISITLLILIRWRQTIARWNCLSKADLIWAFKQGANTITRNNYLLRANRQYVEFVVPLSLFACLRSPVLACTLRTDNTYCLGQVFLYCLFGINYAFFDLCVIYIGLTWRYNVSGG